MAVQLSYGGVSWRLPKEWTLESIRDDIKNAMDDRSALSIDLGEGETLILNPHLAGPRGGLGRPGRPEQGPLVVGPRRHGQLGDRERHQVLPREPHRLRERECHQLRPGQLSYDPGSVISYNPGSVISYNPGSVISYNPGSVISSGSGSITISWSAGPTAYRR